MCLIKRALNAMTGQSVHDAEVVNKLLAKRQTLVEQQNAQFTAAVDSLQKMEFPITPEQERIADELDKEYT